MDPSGSEWTVETLRHYFEVLVHEKDLRDQQRYDAQQKALEAALLAQEKAVATAMAAAEKAVVKAELAVDKRIEGLNELRGIVSDISTLQMPRIEADQRFGALSSKVDELKVTVTTSAGRSSGIQAGWGYLVALVVVAGGIAGLIGHFIK
jgi:hypothetical protein